MQNEPSEPAFRIDDLLVHREWVARVARSLVHGDAEADDLEQRAWIRILDRPPAEAPRSPRGWLRGVLRFAAIDQARAESTRRGHEESAAVPERVEATPASLVARAETLDRVVHAVLDLDEPYRGTILLRYFEDLLPGEIARRQGIPVETVRTRTKRAIGMLRERLDAHSGGDRRAWCLALQPLIGKTEGAFPASATTGSGVTVATGSTLGGILMANKSLAAAAAVLLLSGAGWLALRSTGPDPAPMASVPANAAPPPATVPAPLPTSPAAPKAEADGDLPPPVDLAKCDRDRDLFGTVVDGKEVPVPGATVQVEVYPWQGVGSMNRERYYDMVPGPSTRTAIDGTFRLRLRRGETVSLRVRKEGLAERFHSHVLAGERLHIVLAAGSDLSVTVADAGGTAVAGARLRLWRVTPASLREIERTGTTGSDGRFVFESLPSGKVWLSADAVDRPLPNWVQADIPSGTATAIEIKLPLSRLVEGRVVDAVSELPIAGARVGIGWTMLHTVATGKDGTYRMDTWAPGQGHPELYASADGYVTTGIEVPDEGDLDFALRPGDVVKGRVVDASGSPVAGAFVATHPPDRNAPPPPGPQPFDYAATRTDPDGRFTLRGLDHAAEFHSLAVEAPGAGLLVRDFPPPPTEGGTVDLGDIALPRPRAIEGILLGPTGRPVPGAGVLVRGEFPDRGKGMPGGGSPSNSGSRRIHRLCRTDDLGRFRFTDLSPGPCTVVAMVEGASRIEKAVVIPADRDLLDVLLGGAKASGAMLRVLVVDEAGTPLEGIPIMLMPEGSASVNRETNASGVATFQGLVTTRSCLVQILWMGPRVEGYAKPPAQTVRPEGQEIRFVLAEGAEVRGVVVDGRNAPLDRMEVQACLQGEGEGIQGWAVSDERGEFRMLAPRGKPLRIFLTGRKVAPVDPKARTRVMPETISLRGEATGVLAPAAGIRIVAAESVLDRSLEILVLDPDERPIRDMTVSLQGGPLREARTGPDGRVRMEGLAADRVLLIVLPGRRNPVPEDHVPPAGVWVVPEGQALTLRFTRGVFLKGRVLLPDGSPAVGATVTCFEPNKAISSAPATADADGRFRVAMPPGILPHASASLTGADGVFLIGFAESVDPSAGEVEIRLRPKKK